jgi:murein DD-endopeptidase MepM/ murein hydrolase activator NlpD
MSNLIGIHDREGHVLTPPGSWIVDTVALSENPAPLAYDPGYQWLVRLNHGYGSTGTLPTADRYEAFARRVADYVAGCSGCARWIIGNEPNLAREWPDGQPILPQDYAACYNLCYKAIHALPGHAYDEVLVAASGPWNDELKYAGNPHGDWVGYFTDCLAYCHHVDGVALHAYTHGYDPALVTSDAKMNAPFENRHYNFRTYRDYCYAVSPLLWGESFYLTEANGDGPWQATGLMPAMLAEIDDWNARTIPTIQCVAFFRYPRYDHFYIEGKGDVVAEYQMAAALGYQSPGNVSAPPLPNPPEPGHGPGPIERDIDPALYVRGVEFDFVTPPAGTWYWRMTQAQWLEDAAHQVGPDHHILGRVLKGGVEKAGVTLRVDWPSGSTTVVSKADDPNATFNYDFAMSKSLNEYSIRVDDGAPSDKVSGIGMGYGGNPAAHSSTWITFEFVQVTESAPLPPWPEPEPEPGRGDLIWPVVGPVTQRFGEPPARFGQAGHNGFDIAVPIGTPVKAIADGEVMFVGNDRDYGLYVRVYHRALHSHSFLAHLSEIDVQVGQPVKQGDTLGASGNTGNSTGPHVHFEMRAGGRDDYYEGLCYGYTQGRYDPAVAYALTGSPLSPTADAG